MNNLKIGDKVVMNDKYHVSAESKGKVLTVESEPWECCGTTVVKLEGKAGGYAVDGLDLIRKRDEYIKREVLSKIMNDIAGDETCPMNIAADIYYALDCAPAADVEPVRHGRWDKYAVTRCIVDKTGSLIDREKRAYRCSECGRKSAIKENYCPHCGAKMDEECKK